MNRRRARRRGAASRAAGRSRTGAGGPAPHGVLVVDKPEGPTSHDIVESARRSLGTRAGHTGTLDPLATGVLPLVLGKATRLSRFYQNQDKEYLARISLGRTTETYDREGAVVREGPVPQLSTREVREFLDRFTGEIPQRPPLYSAVRVKGRRPLRTGPAQAAGRASPPPRQDSWNRVVGTETGGVDAPGSLFRRNLHPDAGPRPGRGDRLRGFSGESETDSLRRLRPVPGGIARTDGRRNGAAPISPLEALLPELPRVELEDPEAKRVRHGGQVEIDPPLPGGWCRIFHGGRLVALGETDAGTIQPSIVLDPL